MRIPILACVVAAALSLQACGKAELSRDEARRLILQKPEISSIASELHLSSGSQTLGIQLDLWNQHNELTANGEEVIAAIQGQSISPRSPAGIELEVSGIAPVPMSEGLREVEFSFGVIGLKLPVKALVNNRASGRSVARLFDDGWRIESVEYSWSRNPAPLPPTDAQALAEQVEKVAAARNQRLRTLETLLADSRKPTKRLFVVNGPMNWAQSTTAKAVAVTDVGIVAESVISVWARTYSADQRLSHEDSYLYPFDLLESIDNRIFAGPNHIVLRMNCLADRDYCRDLPMDSGYEAYLRFETPDQAEPVRAVLQEAYSAWLRKYSAAREEQNRIRALIAASNHT